jgi:hypothetical protein
VTPDGMTDWVEAIFAAVFVVALLSAIGLGLWALYKHVRRMR